MHWCNDENLALLSAIPVVGFYFRKLHAWYHSKIHHPCHHEGCAQPHVEHSDASPVIHEEEDTLWKAAGFPNEAEFDAYIIDHPDFELTTHEKIV